MKPEAQNLKELLRKIIRDEVFVTKDRARIVNPSGREEKWLFDFRNILLTPKHLHLVADIFLDEHESAHPFQVGCLEVAAIPLISAIAVKSLARGKPVNAFFVRKSRKKQGLMRMVEGKVTDDPIILVDDLINSGNSFVRQIKVLEAMGKKANELWTIVAFRDLSTYAFAKERGVPVRTLFSLADFGVEFSEEHTPPPPEGFSVLWRFASANPSYFHVNPKSAPALDDQRVYFGSDAAYFWALNQSDGSVAWKKRVGIVPKGKAIFSTPALHGGSVYFGAYDGNVYALDAETGKTKWVFMEADWIGSSPALAPDLNLLFIGLEFGLFKKHGGIAALNMKTGEKAWESRTSDLTHGSPAYSKKYGVVVVGSNDGIVYAYRAKNGTLLWQTKTDGPVKASLAFDEERGYVAFGSFDGNIYIVRIKDGVVAHTFPTGAGIYSTPLVRGDLLYIASLDKNLWCINLKTFAVEWNFMTSGRIYASPIIADGSLFIGSNDGRLYELDPATGKQKSFFQTTERIVNAIAYNNSSKHFFVPTFANELYALKGK